jgi:polysaccharide pyruvyl transferase WcaK-like protein
MGGNQVNVVGWYGKRNCGDESYKLAFPCVFPEYEFVFSDQPIEKADAYILGGGDILNNSLLAKFQNIKKPKHVMSVTASSKIEKKMLDGFRTIIVRDTASHANLKSIGVDALLYPDFSFALSYNKERGAQLIKSFFDKEKHDLYDKKVVVVMNGHMVPYHAAPAYEYARLDKLCYDLAISLDQTPASFIFIPFGTKAPWDDRLPNGIVASRCKYWKKNVMVYDELGVQDILDMISGSHAVISSRLHSSIFSATCERPFVDITHSHKNRYFLETIGYKKASIGYDSFNSTQMTTMLKHAIFDRNAAEEIGSIVSLNKFLLTGLSKSILLT